MSPLVKSIVGVAITVLESAIAVLVVVPGNQGEDVLRLIVTALKALIMSSDSTEAVKAAQKTLKKA